MNYGGLLQLINGTRRRKPPNCSAFSLLILPSSSNHETVMRLYISIPQAVTEHMYYDISAYPLPRACVLFVRNSAGICMQCMHLIYMEVRVMQLQ